MKSFYENGLNFECARCSSCCRFTPGFVYLSKRDLTLLSQSFNLTEDEFIEKYCRWVPYYYGKEALCLEEKENNDCILWDNGCIAYTSRPVQCSTYPFWSWMLKDKSVWDDVAKGCPGMNKGKLHPADEIIEQKTYYDHNGSEIITR